MSKESARFPLIDAFCRVKQTQAVLSIWLECASEYSDNRTTDMIASIMTLLEGVPEVIDRAEGEIAELKASQKEVSK